MFEKSEHKLWSYEDEEYCDEEKDYSPILEGPEDSEDSKEMSRSRRNYITPAISLEIRSIFSSPERSANTYSARPITSV